MTSLSLKVSKIITAGRNRPASKTRQSPQTLREEICQSLKTGRTYVLDPDKKFTPKPARAGGRALEGNEFIALDHGLRNIP